MEVCCCKLFVDCISEVWPHIHFYLALILTMMTTKEPPESGVWNIACTQMMNTPTGCIQNTAYISTIIKLKMVQTFKAISDKLNAYRIHTYTNGISVNKIILLIWMKMIQFQWFKITWQKQCHLTQVRIKG